MPWWGGGGREPPTAGLESGGGEVSLEELRAEEGRLRQELEVRAQEALTACVAPPCRCFLPETRPASASAASAAPSYFTPCFLGPCTPCLCLYLVRCFPLLLLTRSIRGGPAGGRRLAHSWTRRRAATPPSPLPLLACLTHPRCVRATREVLREPGICSVVLPDWCRRAQYCFMNSAVQCLRHTPNLVDTIVQSVGEGADAGLLSSFAHLLQQL